MAVSEFRQVDDLREPAPLGGRVSRETLGRQIANALRNQILLGELRPGQHLNQQQVCERFGVSRMPVRDAFMLLTYEGFVVDEGAGRLAVARLTRRDHEDVYMIEGILHGIACRRATEAATSDELIELKDLHERLASAVRARDGAAMATLNWAFHRRINQISASPKLTAALKPLAQSIPRELFSSVPSWGSKAVAVQQKLLAAMRARDAERAEEIMVKHVNEAGADFLKFLQGRGVDFAS
ncbi:MAG: FCD domain-containing protein [Micromonosporaceae bacterium]|nr:FCD domain-containing protein [Micromonosporaceae bacterium]